MLFPHIQLYSQNSFTLFILPFSPYLMHELFENQSILIHILLSLDKLSLPTPQPKERKHIVLKMIISKSGFLKIDSVMNYILKGSLINF